MFTHSGHDRNTERGDKKRAPDGPASASPEAGALNPLWQSLAFGSGVLQRKLAVGAPGDVYEQEADRVAERVTSTPAPVVQRACACGGSCGECSGEEDASLRVRTKRVDGATVDAEAPPVVEEALRSPSEPLDEGTRGFMEERLGHDFGGVRLHSGAKAAESARAVNSLAYTVGPDIVLGAAAPTPGTDAGRKLLAHELTHVVQQSGTSGVPALQRWSLSNCNQAQTVYVEDAFAKSYDDLTKAVSMMSPPTSPFVKNALYLAFRDDSEDTANKARERIGKLQKNITSTHVTCQPDTHADCKDKDGSIYDGYHTGGEVYLCMPKYTNLDPIRQSNVLTHEAAHKYLDVRDTGYFTNNCDETASRPGPEDKDSGTAGDNPVYRFNNADSYSCFVHFLVRRKVAEVEKSAGEFKGSGLEMEAKEKFIYTVTAMPSRDAGAFRILGAPTNSGFRYRWKFTSAAGEEFPLAAMNNSTRNPALFEDDVTAVYVPSESRRLLGEKKVKKATVECLIQLFKPDKGDYVPPTVTKSVEVDVYEGQDPFDTSKV